MKALALIFVLGIASIAFADDDPCSDAVTDPIATPVRDVYLDAQRSACLREEISAGMLAHALIDTPGFHGVLGGDMSVGARFVLETHYELSAQLRLVDVAFVQNAVNKTTHAGAGPIVLGAAAGTAIGAGARGALVAELELPYTRDEMDTMRVSGQLSAVVTGKLADRVVLHTRLGGVAMIASSLGGDTERLAFRAGSDIAWQLRARLMLMAGAELSAGWYHGFDHVLVRVGVHWRVAERWRLLAGLGAPLAGDERTNAILGVTLAHDR